MLGFKERLHVIDALLQAREHLRGSGASVLQLATAPDEGFITNPDIFAMRSAGFPHHWAGGCLLFARTLRRKELNLLCSYATHLNRQTGGDVEVLSQLAQRLESTKMDERSFVRSVFALTFNNMERAKPAIRADNVPNMNRMLDCLDADIKYLIDLVRSYKLHT